MSAPPSVGPLDLVLHLGMGKTGTSTIQFFLRDHRDDLASQGLLYPATPGRGRHHKLSLSVKPLRELERSPEWSRVDQEDPAKFRRRFRRRLMEEVAESGLSRVLLSDEVLFGSSDPVLRRLGRWTSGIARTKRVLVYLRRQDDHMVSRYQEEVKVGEVRRLEAWSRQPMRSLYDYYARLRKVQERLAPADVEVRRYERDRFPGGSVLEDFLEAIGVDLSVAGSAGGGDRNVGLDAESVEFLRLLNLHRVEQESAVPGLIDNRDLRQRLADASDGPSLTLPAAFLDSFMTRWEASNERVAREFLRDRSGVLFRAPRKSGGTTLEQRLDPARIEHFVRVAELSEDLVAPLRALADRESKPV
jgi:hypothetical protein